MDSLSDLALTQDRDIYLTDQNDLATVSGVDNVEQSLGITLGGEARELLGTQLSGTRIRALLSAIEDEIARDPQIAEIESIDIVELNKQTNSITVSIMTKANNEFEVTL